MQIISRSREAKLERARLQRSSPDMVDGTEMPVSLEKRVSDSGLRIVWVQSEIACFTVDSELVPNAIVATYQCVIGLCHAFGKTGGIG